MYIRIKREKQTIFLYTDPTETIADVKTKLSSLTNVPSSHIRLIFHDLVMDDDKTIGDHKADNDNIVYMVFQKDGKISSLQTKLITIDMAV